MPGQVEWPELTSVQEMELWAVPLATFFLFCVLSYLIPERRFGKAPKDVKKDPESGNAIPDENTALLVPKDGGAKTYLPGESAGDYSAPWTETFDLTFLIFMGGWFAALVVATQVTQPELWGNKVFWIYQVPKPLVMILVSVCMGLICRAFCAVDESGYIQTNVSSWFKVNYTRKVQHFCAYFIPLVITVPASCNCNGSLETAWGQWITIMCFMIMIKPIREAPVIGTFFMLQFNSMDRPEDRPETLKWIVAGNIIPGTLLILIWRHLFMAISPHYSDLVLIFVFVTGLGDGLAEPVGIWLGSHQYKVRSCTSDRKYTRSWEGSACVFMSGMIFTAYEYEHFANSTQFWVCFWLMGPIMAIAEATSPHTMDTPMLMGCGGLIIYVCLLLF